jgi:catechol O-methyltransferase
MMTFKPGKLAVARRSIEQVRPVPKVLVECGAYVGNSAVAWGAMLRELNPGQAVRVFTLELDPEFAQIARDVVELAGLSDVVSVLQGPSGESLRKLQGEYGVEKIDVLFLDHWEDAYLPDLQLCEELGLLKKGGLVLADNTDMPGAPRYLEYVKAGGSRRDGGVRYQSESVESEEQGQGPKIVEVSWVVGA